MAYRIGRCLLSIRFREVGMTQSKLARRLCVSRQQVYKWVINEQGMSMETARNVADILGLETMEELFEWIPTTRNRK